MLKKKIVEKSSKILRKCTVAFKTQGWGAEHVLHRKKTASAGEGAKQRTV